MTLEMSMSDQSRSGAISDAYPSRAGEMAGLLERLDPVVYATHYDDGPLSGQDVEQYERDGFLVLENLFNDKEIGSLQRELERLRGPGRPTRGEHCIYEPCDDTLRSIFAIHEFDCLFADLARNRRLVDVAGYLLDDTVYIHQSRLNCKPAFRGKEFYWHSDFETWHVEDGMPRMRALSMSVALTENYSCNGPLMLIPGSHRRYVACEGETPENHFRSSLRKQVYGTPPEELLIELAAERGITTVDASPGSVIIFDCNTMHGSNGNITPYPRSNAFFVYNAMSNRVVAPFCGRSPRPESICTRQSVSPISPIAGSLEKN